MVGYITKWWWGGDPNKPHELSDLTLRDIHYIQQAWIPLYADAGDYGVEIFLRLFNKDPETKTFFKSVRGLEDTQIRQSSLFRAHAINLMSAFNMAIMNLHQPEVVIAMMHKLGDSHRKHRIPEYHFETLKNILISFLKNDRKATPALLKSWNRFINFIYPSIFERLNAA